MARRKKLIGGYANPNLAKALDIFCEENNVSKSEVLSILVLQFLADADSTPERSVRLIELTVLEDLVASKFSPKKTKVWENKDLTAILNNLLIPNPDEWGAKQEKRD